MHTISGTASPASAQESASGHVHGPWWHNKRYLSLFVLVATLFAGVLQGVPALQTSASASVSGGLSGVTDPPPGYGFNDAINYWSSQGWPTNSRNVTNTRILCNLQPSTGGCVNTRQFIDGSGTYGDADGQLRNFLLGQPNAPQCAVTGSTPCVGAQPVSAWIGNFHEYDVTWRDTRNGTRDRLRIVRVHGGPNTGDTFVTTDHYENFIFIGTRF